MGSQAVSHDADQIGLIVSLVAAIVFVLMRMGARWFKTRHIIAHDMEDIWIYIALVSFVIFDALYLDTVSVYFRLMAVQAGTLQPWATLESDVTRMLKELFVTQFFLWITLWSVKLSLLFMFKRLTDGLSRYNQVWWAVLVFTVLAFIGCCITQFTACDSINDWFIIGACTSPTNERNQEISLWFSLAVDVLTDLMIMAIPIRVLWNLKISLLEKISVGVVFLVGCITMICAIVRSVSLSDTTSTSTGRVDTTWLLLWAGIEGAVAIIVGCLPSFAVFIRGRVAASRAQYGSSGRNHKKASGYLGGIGSRKMESSSNSHRDGGGIGSGRDRVIDPWPTTDVASDKSLVDLNGSNSRSDVDATGEADNSPAGGSSNSSSNGKITVTRGWSQKWHQADREKAADGTSSKGRGADYEMHVYSV